MTFEEYYRKITELCIVDNNSTWCSYLLPDYKVLLKTNNLWPDVVEDYALTIEDVSEMLKLEVDMRHAITSKNKILTEWIYEIIDGTLNPAIKESEAEIINQVISLLKDKADIDKKKNMLADIELARSQESKQESAYKSINFAKKELKS